MDKQKNILVIGAGNGIGLELVKKLKNSYEVYAVTRTKNPETDAIGVNFFYEDVNLSQNFISEMPASIEGLVFCPGSIQLKPFIRFTQEEYLKDFHQNVLSAIRIIQGLMPNLKKAGSASIVMYSTVAVKLGMPFHSSIAMSKGAVEGLVKSLAAEFAPFSIRVNAIAPSLTDTGLAAPFLNTSEKREASAKRHPLNKIGKPEHMATLTSFLLNDESEFITGQIIGADGGLGSLRL